MDMCKELSISVRFPICEQIFNYNKRLTESLDKTGGKSPSKELPPTWPLTVVRHSVIPLVTKGGGGEDEKWAAVDVLDNFSR